MPPEGVEPVSVAGVELLQMVWEGERVLLPTGGVTCMVLLAVQEVEPD